MLKGSGLQDFDDDDLNAAFGTNYTVPVKEYIDAFRSDGKRCFTKGAK